LKPRERLTFEIDAYNVDEVFASLPFDAWTNENQVFGRVNITSAHPSFNRIVPVTGMCTSAAA